MRRLRPPRRLVSLSASRYESPASIDSSKNYINASATPIDDETHFDAMVEELLEDLRIELEDSEESENDK